MTLLHHPLHLLQVADGPAQPVDHRPLVFVNVAVGVGNAVGMEVGVVVLHLLGIFMKIGHFAPSFSNLISPLYTGRPGMASPPGGL